jgi:nitrite reductase/ring-hydroxylating ferredoxin subunit
MTRRGLLAGSATVVAALALSACAGSEDTAAGDTSDGGGGSASSESAAASDSAGSGSDSAGAVLATVGEFPTGGGKVVSTDAGVVVVTEPADGEYKAFNGRCPHQGCPVSEVLENTIICQCHGSVFDASTGDRLEGPAPVGLTPVAIVVQGDSIRLA